MATNPAAELARQRWARDTRTPAERSEAGRKAVELGWQRKVDPDGVMTAAELATAVAEAKKQYHQQLGRLGAAARWGPRSNAAPKAA